MTSVLIMTGVENLQQAIYMTVSALRDMPGAYVSLNKTQRSAEAGLSQAGIGCKSIFFIDCVTQEKVRDDVLHISPDRLDVLAAALREFCADIKGQKYVVIDAISTLLIYNSSSKVAQFVREITDMASASDINLIAFSPKTKGEDLLNMIYNFFDKVDVR
jgi:archaellum biogenesis ATPase FlaH